VYSSFEFTTDGIYIVIENLNQGMSSYSMGPTIGVLAATRATNLSPYHYGSYQIDGDTITLEGFGVIGVISFTAEEFIFSFTIENSDEKYEFNTEKVENAIENSSRTAMFCRYWKVSSVDPPNYYYPKLMNFLFSNAGTYLVIYEDGTAGLSEWKWGDAGKTFIQYSWENWEDDWEETHCDILELTSSSLKMREEIDGIEVTYELEIEQ
jgi:hypothetical protein